jgi:putative membrane protein
MIRFIARILIGMLGLWLAAFLLPKHISYSDLTSLLIAAVVLGIANAIVRPILVVLTLPISIITLGLFLFVINGLVLWLVGHFVPGFHVVGFLDAILGAIIVGLSAGSATSCWGRRRLRPGAKPCRHRRARPGDPFLRVSNGWGSHPAYPWLPGPARP